MTEKVNAISNNTWGQLNLKATDEKLTPFEQVRKYAFYLPMLGGSLLISLFLSFIYVRYQEPVYKSSTSVLVKSDEENSLGGASGNRNNDLLEFALFGNNFINIDNEIELLKSKTLLKNVVAKNKFNHSYFQLGKIRKSEIFGKAPFEVEYVSISDSSSSKSIKVSNITEAGLNIEYTGAPEESQKYKINWREWIMLKGARVRFIPKFNEVPIDEYLFAYQPIHLVADEISNNLTVTSLSNRTTIINLTVKAKSLNKASAILDAIVKEYNEQNIEDKRLVLDKTIDFISQRLEVVSNELGTAETAIKNFKQENQLIDLEIQASQGLTKKLSVEDEMSQVLIERELLNSLIQYVNKMKADPDVIPAYIGLNNYSVNNLIEQYNQLVLKMKRDEASLGKNSIVLADLTLNLREAYNGINESLQEVLKSLEIRERKIFDQRKTLGNFIQSAPISEKRFGEIKRQQTVKEGLYLYLLQKREEYAISSSSTISNFKQIDLATGSSTPFEPRAFRIYLLACIVGLLIPILIINLIELFDDKVKTRKDIIKATSIPIVAEIGHSEMSTGNKLVVAAKTRDTISEEFRILRTNLSFILQDKKVILVTSSMPGEGKSFIAINLAAVIAISNKRIALLEFDLRKPGIVNSIGLEKSQFGISNYLAGQDIELNKLYTELEGYPAFHVYSSGPIPPNPAELLTYSTADRLFEYLRLNYDYIVVDTAPVGLVSDAFNMMKFVDMTIFLVRQRKTFTKSLNFVEDLYSNGQLKNAAIVLNDVKVGGRYGYYGRNYSYSTYGKYKYGYSRKGESDYFEGDTYVKKWWKMF